ncbi:MAG: polysaccharide deacetylase family protein [Crocinitomicaceae bacterium]|nr:polysaccharide deacetylase family protein [Crocinitomicaceae bacterium]
MRIYKTPRFSKWIFPKKTWGFSRKKPNVYLTFDDGPDPEITPWVLDLLKVYNIQATFFCVGENVKNYPELYQRILMERHQVGNHTMYHNKGTNTSFEAYCSSIEAAAQLIDSKLFRPPYGRITPKQTGFVKKKFQLIMWTWLSYDYDQTVGIDTIIDKAQKQIKAGDILVFHDNKKTKERLKKLLPNVIEIIRSKNLSFHKINNHVAN